MHEAARQRHTHTTTTNKYNELFLFDVIRAVYACNRLAIIATLVMAYVATICDCVCAFSLSLSQRRNTCKCWWKMEISFILFFPSLSFSWSREYVCRSCCPVVSIRHSVVIAFGSEQINMFVRNS